MRPETPPPRTPAGTSGAGGTGADPGAGAAADEALIAAFLASRPDAVRDVSGWIRSVTAHRAWGFDDSEDLVQTTLLALVRNLRAGRFAPGDFRAYVRAVAKNICLSSYRKARVRAREVPLEEADGEADGGPRSAGPDPGRRAILERVLERLEDACRQILALAYLEDLSRAEIAARLGVSEGAARVRLFRCLEKARQARP
jgi:RNA polymerase sigma-70 factor (ECF subfamily)